MSTSSPFHTAVKKNNVAIVKRFLNGGTRPDSVACSYAIQHKANDVLKSLVAAGAEVNRPEAYWGYTPLTRALLSKNLVAFRILLKGGAYIDRRGGTHAPLHVAAMEGFLAGAKLCIANGAKLERRDIAGNTPLMLAASLGHIDVAKLLVRAGANVRALNAAGQTSCELALANGEEEVVRLLGPLSQGIRKRKRGIDALMEAVSSRDLTGVEACLKKGVDINERDRFGRSPMEKAISLGWMQCIKLMVEAGVDLNKVGPDGMSFLEGALRAEQLDIAKMLLDSGALPNPSGNRYGDALNMACALGSVELAMMLIRHGSKPSTPDPLISAVQQRSSELLKALLTAGAAVDGADDAGWTALFWSVFTPSKANQKQPTRRNRSEVGAKSSSLMGEEEMMETIVKLLIKHGADANRRDNAGRTALTYTGSARVARLLIKSGARLDIRDNDGRNTTDWLLSNGVNLTITSSRRGSPSKRVT